MKFIFIIFFLLLYELIFVLIIYIYSCVGKIKNLFNVKLEYWHNISGNYHALLVIDEEKLTECNGLG